jgi:hypothetical protein
MGKRSREVRKQVKKLLRHYGVVETELGELKVKMTKAEARRRLLRAELSREEAFQSIMETMSRQAMADICAMEDARVFAMLDQCAYPSVT